MIITTTNQLVRHAVAEVKLLGRQHARSNAWLSAALAERRRIRDAHARHKTSHSDWATAFTAYGPYVTSAEHAHQAIHRAYWSFRRDFGAVRALAFRYDETQDTL